VGIIVPPQGDCVLILCSHVQSWLLNQQSNLLRPERLHVRPHQIHSRSMPSMSREIAFAPKSQPSEAAIRCGKLSPSSVWPSTSPTLIHWRGKRAEAADQSADSPVIRASVFRINQDAAREMCFELLVNLSMPQQQGTTESAGEKVFAKIDIVGRLERNLPASFTNLSNST
jgi:hypothetical protein